MNRRATLLTTAVACALGATALYALRLRAGAPNETRPIPAATAPAVPVVHGGDRELSAANAALLDLAFEVARKVPVAPHKKTRARLMEDVVDASLRLGDGARALRLIPEIGDWRRGTAYADYANRLAMNAGEPAEVRHFAELARGVSESDRFDITQDWQRARIRVRAAEALARIGDHAESGKLVDGADRAELGRLESVQAALADDHGFDAIMSHLESLASVNDFDRTKGALEACLILYDRHFDDAARRERIVVAIDTALQKTPPAFRIDAILRFADGALSHADRSAAQALVDRARAIIDGGKWLAEDKIPMVARIAGLRHRTGEKEKAAREIDLAYAIFNAEKPKILDIDYGRMLRSIALAFHVMDDDARALATLKSAVEESLVNPNSRPRAEDLVATLLMLATEGIKPDTELAARLHAVLEGLGAPW